MTLIAQRHNGTVSHFCITVTIACDDVSSGLRNDFEVERCKERAKEQLLYGAVVVL